VRTSSAAASAAVALNPSAEFSPAYARIGSTALVPLNEDPALMAERLPADQRLRPARAQRRVRGRIVGVLLVVHRLERVVERAHRHARHHAVEKGDGEDQQERDHHDCRNPWRGNAIQLAHQIADQSSDQLAEFHEREQEDDSQHRGQRVFPERQPRHPHQVTYVVLPDVEPDDGQDLADDADDDEAQPRAARGGGTGVLGSHVAHQPDPEHAEQVTDRARGAAHQTLEQRSAR
jgi:hypothetical protein